MGIFERFKSIFNESRVGPNATDSADGDEIEPDWAFHERNLGDASPVSEGGTLAHELGHSLSPEGDDAQPDYLDTDSDDDGSSPTGTGEAAGLASDAGAEAADPMGKLYVGTDVGVFSENDAAGGTGRDVLLGGAGNDILLGGEDGDQAASNNLKQMGLASHDYQDSHSGALPTADGEQPAERETAEFSGEDESDAARPDADQLLDWQGEFDSAEGGSTGVGRVGGKMHLEDVSLGDEESVDDMAAPDEEPQGSPGTMTVTGDYILHAGGLDETDQETVPGLTSGIDTSSPGTVPTEESSLNYEEIKVTYDNLGDSDDNPDELSTPDSDETAENAGGGILNQGSLTLSQSTLSGNSAEGPPLFRGEVTSLEPHYSEASGRAEPGGGLGKPIDEDLPPYGPPADSASGLQVEQDASGIIAEDVEGEFLSTLANLIESPDPTMSAMTESLSSTGVAELEFDEDAELDGPEV